MGACSPRSTTTSAIRRPSPRRCRPSPTRASPDKQTRDSVRDGVLRAVCLTYLVRALAFNALTPVGEPPDETDHFLYVAVVAEDARLPRASEDLWQGHQAPLYYLAAAGWARVINAVSGCRYDPSWLPTRVNPGFPNAANFNRL